MFGKKKKPVDINLVKENLVNLVFEKILVPHIDYTIMAEVNGTKYVKKTTHWAYCEIVNGKVQALFAIETDKGVFCFQMMNENISRVDPAIYAQMNPQVLS